MNPSKTNLQLCKATNQARRKAGKAWNDYVLMRRSYRHGGVTEAELAHALTLADLAHAKLAAVEAKYR